MPLHFQFPNTTNLAKGTAVHLAFKYGMQSAKPFEVSDAVGANGESRFNVVNDLLGAPRLTSLGLEYGVDKIEIDECVLTVTQERNIITTALQGRDGTIKEYINDGDYNITANIAVSNFQDHSYPEQALKKLVQLIETKDTIAVDSAFLEVFEIKSAVVISYSLEQETHSNRQSLQLQLLSDKPYEIKLKDDA